MNSIFTIEPYWTGGTWAFDAPEVELLAEPFVSGADQIISVLVGEHLGLKPQPGSRFQMIFSAEGFPGYHARFQRQEPEFGGYWYKVLDDSNRFADGEFGDRGWLCPATLCFFPDGHPPELYIQVRPLP